MVSRRDTVSTTLPWFFYNHAMKLHVVSAIRDELAPIAAARKDDDTMMMTFSSEDTKPLVYLQATLLEMLRLYPPGCFERKTVVTDDVMPRGHEVRAGDTVLISAYSMGRMESPWGKDCYEYRPERWLYDDDDVGGGARKKKRLRYVASHMFLAFNSGPRMCLRKHIAIMQMKTVAAAVVWNFDVEVVEGHTVEPKLSYEEWGHAQ
uniref:Cytochrome P450 n=1 Tax=Leersia perrieri TaxID=77586 RepID=A0A0D9X5Z2_9ORYZ